MEFTLSVRSFQTPAHALNTAWPPSLPSGTNLTSNTSHFGSERIQLRHMVFTTRAVCRNLFERAAIHFQRHGLRKIALGDGADHSEPLPWRAAPDRRSGPFTESTHSAHPPEADPRLARAG